VRRSGQEAQLRRETLAYEALERLTVPRPVDRLSYIAELCRGKRVLDLGCMDETAQVKRGGEHWLHGRIVEVATQVVGIDNSVLVPVEGIQTGPNSVILRGDATDPPEFEVDIVVAGELIEHIENPLAFLRMLKQRFAGAELVLSTPNGLAFYNTVMGVIGRESQHPDHIQSFTFKILHTLCARADLEAWEVIPSTFGATEMIMKSTWPIRVVARGFERFVNAVGRCFPLLSASYIVRARI
jgi:hypothetical protein